MKSLLFLTSALIFTLGSCASNDDFQDRMDKRNDAYGNLQERRDIRLKARQGRTDDWYDRAMH